MAWRSTRRFRTNARKILIFARHQDAWREFEVFDTNDLYRGNDMRKVVQCIHSIGTAVKKSGWTGSSPARREDRVSQ